MHTKLLSMLVLVLLIGCTPAVSVQSSPSSPTSIPSTTPVVIPTDAPTPIGTITVTLPPIPTTVAATQAPTTARTEVHKTLADMIAYVGLDGNLWLVAPAGGEIRQVTTDAANPAPDSKAKSVQYCCSKWSSDGQLLAFEKAVGTPVDSGYTIENSLWVYDLQSGQSKAAIQNHGVSGFAWKPFTHLIAYSWPVAPEYLSTRGTTDPKFAQGIWAVNVDTGLDQELVGPSRGFSLVGPVWSADGQYLGFDEVMYMEGRGNFAYYDFEALSYHAFEKPIGQYTFLTNLKRIAFDNLTYAPTGEEKIWSVDMDGKDEKLIYSPDKPGYAYGPQVSPKGDLIAFLYARTDTTATKVMVLPASGGEARLLLEVEQVNYLGWSPDGSALLVSVGPYDKSDIEVIQVSDVSSKLIAKGQQPAW